MSDCTRPRVSGEIQLHYRPTQFALSCSRGSGLRAVSCDIYRSLLVLVHTRREAERSCTCCTRRAAHLQGVLRRYLGLDIKGFGPLEQPGVAPVHRQSETRAVHGGLRLSAAAAPSDINVGSGSLSKAMKRMSKQTSTCAR